jgi:hypothetical protein
VLSKRELLKRVWSDVVVEDGSLRFHMAGLRKLLGDGKDGARYIATQVGVGYAFVARVERQAGMGTPPAPAPESLAAESTAPLSLPSRLPVLIGREGDITLLEQRVPDAQLFAIVGPGGVGKTSLAVEMGHRLAGALPGRSPLSISRCWKIPLVPGMIAGAMGASCRARTRWP